MAMQYEATLRLKGDDQTAEAFRSASEGARRFADQQTRATRGLRDDVDSVGRAFRGLRRTAMVGGLAVSQALTLFTTPIVYLYLDKLSNAFANWGRSKSGDAQDLSEHSAVKEAAE